MFRAKAWRTLFSVMLLLGIAAGIGQPRGVRAMFPFVAPSGSQAPPTEQSERNISATLPTGQTNPLDKIEPVLLENLSVAGETDFFIWMTEKADLSPAYQLKTKEEKGYFVYAALRETAERSQAALREAFDRQEIAYRPFYIANKILVKGGTQSLLLNLAYRTDIARITANHAFQLDEPIIDNIPGPGILSVGSNLSFVNADDVWALGHDGAGTVLAGNDTGLAWQHLALINRYRGWNGLSANHHYNWWDATGTYLTAPGDGHGHGTHTTGTMVGDDGGANRIGMAPGAQTVHCKNMTDEGAGSDATFSECFEWNLAPWDLNRANPRPDLAPDVVSNSWGYWYGGAPQFEDELAALHAAGIVVEVSAGNEGPDCSTMRSPGDYPQALTTGAVGYLGAQLPGTLTPFSSRGPSSLYPGDYALDVMAPGEGIRSSIPGNSYESWNGTSMAGPHVTGLVGLMWSANPGLRGLVDETMQIILETAIPLTGQVGSNCGGDYSAGPNNDWGYGTIDALAAVEQAKLYGNTGTLAGTVIDATSLTPIANAVVRATSSPTQSWRTTSNVQGNYALQVLGSAAYTVDASAYGYLPNTITNVLVEKGLTTTLPISLTPAPSYVVSGFITDVNTGYPLYASIEIDGYPGDVIWTDPTTGFYSVSLAAGVSFTFNIKADNYLPLSRSVGPLIGAAAQDFAMTPDFNLGCPSNYEQLLLFYDGFETGRFGSGWETNTTKQGRARIRKSFPHIGAYSLLLDDSTSASSKSLAAATLTQDLSGQSQVTLDFWWREFNDENDPEDGVFISDDNGATWHSVLSFNDGPLVFQNSSVDISAAAAALGLSLNNRFQIKFQFFDDYPLEADGYAIDEVKLVSCTPFPSGRLIGYVRDGNNELPLAGVVVTSDSGKSAATNENGFYELFDSPGSHTITATAPDNYETELQSLIFTQSNTVQQDFSLAAGWLAASPAEMEVTIKLGQSLTVPLALTNNGGQPAAFELQERGGGFIATTAPSPAHNRLHRGGQVQIVDEQESPEPEHSAAAVPASGGPDAFGYTYADSTDPNGPAYDWIEIAPPAGGAGVEIASLTGADNGYFWPLALPFPFTFYGTDYNELAIGSNGVIYFENMYLGLVNTAIPLANTYGVEKFIAPFWDDLKIDPGAVYYQATDSMMIIEFYQAAGYLSPGHSTWQVILFSNGNMLFQYKDTSLGDFRDKGGSATIGIQRDAATGLQYAYNSPALADGQAVCFAYPGQSPDCSPPGVPWLTEGPATGLVAPLTNQDVTLTFDTGVPEITQPGQYYAELLIKNDTPYDMPKIPIVMHVETFGLTLQPTANTQVGDRGAVVTHTLWLTNTGVTTDTFNIATSGNSWATTAPAAVGPRAPDSGEKLDIAVAIPPTAADNAADTATVLVTSQGEPSLSTTAVLTTIARPGASPPEEPGTRLFLPVILRQ